MIRPRVGLLVIGFPFYRSEYWAARNRQPGYTCAPFEQVAQEFRDNLEKHGIEVLVHKSIVEDSKEAVDLSERYLAEGADLLLYACAGGISVEYVLKPIEKTRLPFIVWGMNEARRESVMSVWNLKSVFRRLGVHFKWIIALPGDQWALREVQAFARAAFTLRRFKGSKIGAIGSLMGTFRNPLDLYPGTVDLADLVQVFGLELNQLDYFTLIRKIRSVPEDKAKKVRDEVVRELGETKVPESLLTESVRQYIAVKELAKELDLKVVGINDHLEYNPTRGNEITMIPSDVPLVLPCLTNLLLNDEETIYMCENDIMGGVTMLLLRILTDEPSILIDAGEIDWENNAIRFFSCGSVTSGFAKGGRKGIRLSENYELLGRGCSAEFTLRLGRVTLCRFQKVGQDMVMHIARGKIVDSAEKRIPRWPEGVVKLDCSVRTFIEQTYTYHYHIVYHDIVDELVECCGLLGVKPVVT